MLGSRVPFASKHGTAGGEVGSAAVVIKRVAATDLPAHAPA
jgi:hypothetical protein